MPNTLFKKATELGATVISVSDSKRLRDRRVNGIDFSDLSYRRQRKRRARLTEYAAEKPTATTDEGSCDGLVLVTMTSFFHVQLKTKSMAMLQNVWSLKVKVVSEGANMLQHDAINVYKENGNSLRTKAADAGGTAL